MMKIMNKILKAIPTIAPVVTCVVLFSSPVLADELEKHQVRAAVETWVRHVTTCADLEAGVESMEPHKVEGRTVGYIAHLSDGGFCLCGADDLVYPVYLYSPRGTYDPTCPGYQYILWEIGERLTSLEQGLAKRDPKLEQYETALARRASFWQELIAGRVPEREAGVDDGDRADPTSMELLETSYWHQGSPYNDWCPGPPSGADEIVAVGCVATAMAQIMYYWRWPNTGVGNTYVYYHWRHRATWAYEPLATQPAIPASLSGRLEWVSSGGGQLRMKGYWDSSMYAARNIDTSPEYQTAFDNLWGTLTEDQTYCPANFGTATYDWHLMEDDHQDPVDPGDTAVAELCYHASVAVEMNYGLWESGAFLNHPGRRDVYDAMPAYFRYDSTIAWGGRNITTMTTEIQWLRPLEFAGHRPGGGGHAFVICGYDKSTDPDRQFLINFGWGGGSTEWYTCDSVAYTIDQEHVTRIAPNSGVKFVGGPWGGDGSPGTPYYSLYYALLGAADYTTLIFKAGSTNTFTGASLEIDRPLTLKGYNVTIEKQ
ncbi:MAG: C10 family peptidase [Phycisphaerae bacterium]|nr:C10 family peptidase [Phycisphaerae bacterium]